MGRPAALTHRKTRGCKKRNFLTPFAVPPIPGKREVKHGREKAQASRPAARPPGQPHHPGAHPDPAGRLWRGGIHSAVCPALADPDPGLRPLSGAGGGAADRRLRRGRPAGRDLRPQRRGAGHERHGVQHPALPQGDPGLPGGVRRRREKREGAGLPGAHRRVHRLQPGPDPGPGGGGHPETAGKDLLHVRDHRPAGGRGHPKRGAGLHHGEPHHRHLHPAHHHAHLPQGQPGRPGDRLGEPQHGQHRRLRHRGPV